MIYGPETRLSWYHPASAPTDRFTAAGHAAGADHSRRARAAYDPTPKPGGFRGILKLELRGCASHGRGTRPAWQGWRFALPLHPSRAGVSHPMHPCGEPSCSLRPMTEALPLRHHPGAFLPLETLTRAIAPLTTRRRFSHPGTHDQSCRALDIEQAAFMPLHPDEGNSLPRPRAGHAVPAPRPGIPPDPTMGRPWSRRQANPQPQPSEGGMADELTTHHRLFTARLARFTAEARRMARAVGFGERVDLFIITQALGHWIIPEGTS